MLDYKEAKRLLHPDTIRDAIWGIEDKQETINKINEACLVACEAIDEHQKYKQLGTLDEVREAVEKQKKVQPIDEEYCPFCHTFLKDDEDIPGFYCPNCGQHIEWGNKWKEMPLR